MSLLIGLPDEKGEALAEYPVTLRRLKELRPDIGWTAPPRERTLERLGFVVVEPVERPATTLGQKLGEGAPALVDRTWRQTWIVTDPTEPEVASIKASLEQEAEHIAGQLILRALATAASVKLEEIPAVAELQSRLAQAKATITAGSLEEGRAAVRSIETARSEEPAGPASER